MDIYTGLAPTLFLDTHQDTLRLIQIGEEGYIDGEAICISCSQYELYPTCHGHEMIYLGEMVLSNDPHNDPLWYLFICTECEELILWAHDIYRDLSEEYKRRFGEKDTPEMRDLVVGEDVGTAIDWGRSRIWNEERLGGLVIEQKKEINRLTQARFEEFLAKVPPKEQIEEALERLLR